MTQFWHVPQKRFVSLFITDSRDHKCCGQSRMSLDCTVDYNLQVGKCIIDCNELDIH